MGILDLAALLDAEDAVVVQVSYSNYAVGGDGGESPPVVIVRHGGDDVFALLIDELQQWGRRRHRYASCCSSSRNSSSMQQQGPLAVACRAEVQEQQLCSTAVCVACSLNCHTGYWISGS